MTEKLFTGTLNHNQNKQTSSGSSLFAYTIFYSYFNENKKYHPTPLISKTDSSRKVDSGLGLTLLAPNITIAEFANTVDPDERAHNEPSHQDLQCLPSSL